MEFNSGFKGLNATAFHPHGAKPSWKS